MNNENFIIRQEQQKDYKEVFLLIEKAFLNAEHTDHREQYLVQRLRKSPAFIPELSMVAVVEDKLVGHILLTKIIIRESQEKHISLALAPVSVLPEYQKQGIGGKLIEAVHAKAIALGYKSVIVLGHKDYYPKFGYKKASEFGIKLPFEVLDEYCMAIELIPNGHSGVRGTVEYPDEFFQ